MDSASQCDPTLARYAAILPDRPLPVPLSAGPGGAQGVHASGRRARRRPERPAHPWRLPPQPVDRLPPGLRGLPRLHFGARGGRRLPPLAQHAARARPERRPRRRDARPGADLGAVFGVPRLSRPPPLRRRHGRHDGARLRHDGRGQPRRNQAGRIPVARAGQPHHRPRHRPLLGVALTDVLSDGLSMVYSFYEPEYHSRSLGTHMILDHIARARQMGLPYAYLGYWVRDSRKMDYKGRFLPQERLLADGWTRVER